MEMVSITFEPQGCKNYAEQGTLIRDAAFDAGIGIRSECGGEGVCRKCAVIIRDKTSVGRMTQVERKTFSSREIRLGYRLACQAIVRANTVVEIPKETRLIVTRIQTAGMEKRVRPCPLVIKHHLTLPKPTLDDVKPDAERLLDLLSTSLSFNDLKVDHHVLQTLPSVLRRADWDIIATIWNDEVIAVQGGCRTSAYGLAVDIGTSKIAVNLVDLATGESMGFGSVENSQLIHGEDLISRIAYVNESGRKNLKTLQSLTVRDIHTALAEVCRSNGVNRKDIHEVVAVGNTAMLHFFLGIEPKHLAEAPFIPAIKQPLNIKARELKVDVNPAGNIHILPTIAGFVGADAIASVLATGMSDSQEMCLLMDVGTNGEILLGNRDDIIACSCAAGPAFEGWGIKYGMKSSRGAIEKIKIDPETFEVEYSTVGGKRPVGMCGSALVDIIAELFKSGIIDSHGRANSHIQNRRLRTIKGEKEFVVVWKDQTAMGRDITVSWKEIQEILLAKAALRTGCEILMKRKGLTKKDLGKFYLAGAFGSCLSLENAEVLGLIPEVPIERVRLAGNTALSGAKMTLISKESRETADRLSKTIRYVELTVAPEFKTEFVNSLYIPYRDHPKSG